MPGSVREESSSHMRFVYLSACSLLFQFKVSAKQTYEHDKMFKYCWIE